MEENQTGAFLDAAHEGVLAVDADGRVTFLNRAAERLTGVSAEFALGRHVLEVIPNTRLHIVLETGEAELDQLQDTGTAMIMTNRVPVRNSRGEIVGAMATFRDVGELKRLGSEIAALKETRTLLEAIVNSTQDAISVVDENGMGILINPAYTRLTGLTESDVLHRPATVDIAEGESMHLHVLRTGRAVKHVPMKVGAGRREVMVDVAPIVVDGKLKGSVAVIHDVSELRSLNEQLDRAHRLIRHLDSKYTFDDIVAVSPIMREVVAQARKAAATPATVLLVGESGTGKELFAHAIHHASERAKGPFICVNCGAIPDTLQESQLFGYVEGAFTGARRGGQKGFFVEARGGTIFLDEIAESNLAVQTKLLRVLQEKEIVPVGASRPVPVDVRVITATNVDLVSLVEKGRFRSDLFYRLHVLPIHIPPLRERREDIPPLLAALLNKLNKEYSRHVEGITEDALALFRSGDWPGNVREMENMLGRALINMQPGEKMVRAEHLPLPVSTFACPPSGRGEAVDLPGEGGSLADAHAVWEKALLQKLLSAANGNRTRAAGMLKISVRQLYNKLKRYGIE
ncbi:MAG: sigma-54-dependent Fis family transcriptional regulator [Syntrophobacteraceae bacterium]